MNSLIFIYTNNKDIVAGCVHYDIGVQRTTKENWKREERGEQIDKAKNKGYT